MFLPAAFSQTAKQVVFKLIGQDYKKHDVVVDKLTSYITTQQEYEAFSKLLISVYEAGYKRAVNQQNDLLASKGIKAKIVPEKNSNDQPTIFNQKN